MVDEVMAELITNLFFTKADDYLNVEKVIFKNCFRISGREEGLAAALDEIIANKNENKIKYTIKHFEAQESSLSEPKTFEKLIEGVLFNR
jgi:hypothetical protein